LRARREGAHPPGRKKKDESSTNKLTDNFERLSVEHDAQTVLDIRGGGGARANLFVCVRVRNERRRRRKISVTSRGGFSFSLSRLPEARLGRPVSSTRTKKKRRAFDPRFAKWRLILKQTFFVRVCVYLRAFCL